MVVVQRQFCSLSGSVRKSFRQHAQFDHDACYWHAVELFGIWSQAVAPFELQLHLERSSGASSCVVRAFTDDGLDCLPERLIVVSSPIVIKLKTGLISPVCFWGRRETGNSVKCQPGHSESVKRPVLIIRPPWRPGPGPILIW